MRPWVWSSSSAVSTRVVGWYMSVVQHRYRAIIDLFQVQPASSSQRGRAVTRTRLFFPLCLLLPALLFAAPMRATTPANDGTPTMSATRDGSHDFDFLAGR